LLDLLGQGECLVEADKRGLKVVYRLASGEVFTLWRAAGLPVEVGPSANGAATAKRMKQRS
jgi:hypothetical protein